MAQTTLTVATFNMGDGPDSVKITALDKLRDAGAQVICLQEAGDRKKVLTRWSADNGWNAFFGDGTAGASSVPILVTPDLKVTRFHSRLAVPARNVGEGAGPDRSKAKVVNVARIDGGWRVLNTHMIASATRRGSKYDRRRAHFHDHLAVLLDMLRRDTKATQICVGDFNATPEFRMLEPMREIATQVVAGGGTHGRRMIDLAWVVRGRIVDKAQLLSRMSSDHKAVVVTVEQATT